MFSHISRVAAARSLADDVYANKRPITSDLGKSSVSLDPADPFGFRR